MIKKRYQLFRLVASYIFLSLCLSSHKRLLRKRKEGAIVCEKSKRKPCQVYVKRITRVYRNRYRLELCSRLSLSLYLT